MPIWRGANCRLAVVRYRHWVTCRHPLLGLPFRGTSGRCPESLPVHQRGFRCHRFLAHAVDRHDGRIAQVEFGQLTDAWKGEATDFMPLLAEQLDAIGGAIGLDLASIGQSEVHTTGGRRIDIVAQDADGSEFVTENQYGRADHDHLTRGLACTVATPRARCGGGGASRRVPSIGAVPE